MVFILGAVFVYFFRELGNWIPQLATAFIAVLGGIFPTFFLLTAFFSILGLQRFVASEESYAKSATMFIPWIIVSAAIYFVLFLIRPLYDLIFFWIAFFGWIVFQAYLASRSALGYASSVEVTQRSKYITAFFGILNVLSYAIVIGAFIILGLMNPALLTPAGLPVLAGGAIGMIVAIAFNFLNGILILRYRNKRVGDNLALLGLFIALYVAYFEYNILKVQTGATDFFALAVDIGISVFFILYAMSSVGLTLSARAELDTRFKISKELGATLTFFLASGYLTIEAAFEAIGIPILASGPDIIKLLIFPGVALVMELLFIRQTGKVVQPPPMPEDAPVLEPEPEAAEPELIEDDAIEEEFEAEPDEQPDLIEDEFEDTEPDEEPLEEPEEETYELGE